MKIGDLVLDEATGDYVIIIAKNVHWRDCWGIKSEWDFEVMFENTMYYADADELQEVK